MKIMVVHQGKRDDYQVARAFLERGHDVTLVTSAYPGKFICWIAGVLPQFKLLRKLAGRKKSELNLASISGGLLVELFGRFLARFFDDATGQEFIDRNVSSRALRIALREKFDILICYNYNANSIFFDNRLSDSIKVLFQCHPHPVEIRKVFDGLIDRGIIPNNNSEREYSFSCNYVSGLVAECYFSDFNLVASGYTAKSLRNVGIPEEKIAVVPYGCSSAYNEAWTGRGKISNPMKICFVGQFVYRKGIPIIWDVLNRLDFPIEMVFVGRGIRELDPLIGITNKNVKASVRWDVSDRELIDVYQNSEIFFFPSFVEGFGHVILESMSTGCIPVVSTSSCGPDLIVNGENGYCFDPLDVEGFVKSLSALQDPLHREKLMASAFKVSNNFTWLNFRKNVVQSVEHFKKTKDQA